MAQLIKISKISACWCVLKFILKEAFRNSLKVWLHQIPQDEFELPLPARIFRNRLEMSFRMCLCVAGAYLCLETHSTLNLGSRWQRSYGRLVSPARVSVLRENQREEFALNVCVPNRRQKNRMCVHCKRLRKIKKLRFIPRTNFANVNRVFKILKIHLVLRMSRHFFLLEIRQILLKLIKKVYFFSAFQTCR